MNKQKAQVLLNRLEAQLDSPEAARFNMSTFGNAYASWVAGALPGFVPVCGTQACLAGETVLGLGKAKIFETGGILLNSDTEPHAPSRGSQIQKEATEELELTPAQAKKLFFFKKWTIQNWGWPEKYQVMYENAKTPQGRLYAAIRRVEHFIKTNGRQ